MPSRDSRRSRRTSGTSAHSSRTSNTTPTRSTLSDATTRPFSPSPPRDTRHTSSRPPSLLFGARPPTASVATSSSFDLSGLPTGRGRNISGFGGQQAQQHGYFGLPVSATEQREEGGLIVRNDSNDSLSTTSSASPPLGATSILSTLATDDNLSLPLPGSRIHTRDPTPPDAFPAIESQPSSPAQSLNPSRSMPRLHQPTVIRRSSGRIAFLPNAAGPVSPRMDEIDSIDRSIRALSEGIGKRDRQDRRIRHSYASTSSFDSMNLSRYDNDRTISSVDSSFFSSPSSKGIPLPAVHEPKEEDSDFLHEIIEKPPGYRAPYVVRAKHRNRHYPGPSGEPDTATCTFQASITRQPDDGPLPFGAGHVEVRLAWTTPKSFGWLPGRRYIPRWGLHLVKGQEREGTARWLVKGIVSQLPILWRLANWL